MSDRAIPVDPAQVWADDALLDAFADQACTPAPQLPHLTRWRRNLDAAPIPPLDVDLLSAEVAPRKVARPVFPRGVRRSAATLTALVVLAGGSVAAAAASGPTGPLGVLHRALFGTTQHADPRATQITALLNTAAHEIDTAREAGGVTPTGRLRIEATLAKAGNLLLADRHAPTSLRRRHDQLIRALSALPTAPQANRAATDAPKSPGTPTEPVDSSRPPGADGRSISNHAAGPGAATEAPPAPPHRSFGLEPSSHGSPRSGSNNNSASGDASGSDGNADTPGSHPGSDGTSTPAPSATRTSDDSRPGSDSGPRADTSASDSSNGSPSGDIADS